MRIRLIDATVTLRLAAGGKCKVTALDENGYATDKPVQVTADAGSLKITLACDALYHVVQR